MALVMMLGVVQWAGAGTFAKYTDGDKVKYTEAVDVLTGIRVIEGSGGAYRPLDPVTRAEAAAILTRMLLTRDTADSLPVASTGFSDVASSHWAGKYVAYCSSQGIIYGRSDGKFYPNDPVTAAEFAIMLMRALNIGTPSRYTGAAWATNAIADGKEFGLLNTNVDYSRSANREEIAQYAFNALIFTSAGSAQKIWGVIGYKTNAGGALEYEFGWITAPGSASDSIISKKYPTLNITIGDPDDLGRPKTTWSFQNKTVSIQPAYPAKVFSTTVTQKDLFTATGVGAGTSAGDIKAIVNQAGAQNTGLKLRSLRNSEASSNATIYNESGNGIITEIYKTGIGDTAADYLAVVIKPTFATVEVKNTATTTSMGAFLTYSFNSTDSGRLYTSHVDPAREVDTVSISGKVAAGDRVLYYKGKTLLYIEAVGTITGVVTSVTNTDVINMNGKAYYKANAFTGANVAPSTQEGDYYIDGFGYILGVKSAVDTELRIALVLETESYGVLEDNKVIMKNFVTILDINGNITTVNSSEDYKKTLNGVVCSYTIDGRTSKYEFTKINFDVTTTVGNYYVKTANISRIDKGIAQLGTTHSVNLASNTTRFYVINEGNKLNIIPGINNMYTMSPLTATTAVSVGANRSFPGAVAEVVFVYDGDQSRVDPGSVFYLGTYEKTVGGITIDIHKNGENSKVSGIADTPEGIGKLTPLELYKTMTISHSGAVFAEPVTASDTDIRGAGLFKYDVGLLFFKGAVVGVANADVPVYTITSTDGVRSMTSGFAQDINITLRSRGYVYPVIASATEDIKAIYIFDF